MGTAGANPKEGDMHDPIHRLAEQAHQLADALALQAIENGATPACVRTAPDLARMCAKPWGHDGPCVRLRWSALKHLWDEMGQDVPLCCHAGPGRRVNCIKADGHDGEHRYMDFRDADRLWGA